MSDSRNDFEIWEDLLDRRAVGEPLTPEDEAFCTRFVSEHPECAAELEVYAQLAELDSRPDQGTRNLVDATLARMEREEADQERADVAVLRTRRVPTFAALGVAAAAAAALLAAFLMPEAQVTKNELRSPSPLPAARAELAYASGVVSVSGQSARVGKSLLAEGVTVETGEGTACVVIDPEINVCLSEHSRLRLSALGTGARRLDLDAGKVAVRLNPQPMGMSLSIVAGDVWSTAVGTAFSVARGDESGEVVTTVLSGKVRVGREQKEGRIVNAHERAATKAAHSELSTVSRAEEAPSWALLGPTVLWHDPVAATLDVRGEPATAEAWLDGQSLGVAPLSTLIPVGAHRLLVRAGGETLYDGEVRVGAGEVKVVEFRRTEARPAVVAAPIETSKPHAKVEANAKVLTEEQLGLAVQPEQAPTASGMLQDARKLIREQRYADAARTYRELRNVFPGSDEAHTVLVSLGKLELSQLHDPKQALRSLEAYLERGGPLAEEARIARISALATLGDTTREALAIEELLAKHPRSLEAAELRVRLGTLRPTLRPEP